MASDLLQQSLDIGDFVVAYSGYELTVYKVAKLTTKMVRIVRLNAKTVKSKKGQLRYGTELVRIDEKLVTYYMMKN